MELRQLPYLCFVHPMFSSFGFWYFGHFRCIIFFPVFFHLALQALQNANKHYVIFSYFCNFIAKGDKKPKTKNGKNETLVIEKNFWYIIGCWRPRIGNILRSLKPWQTNKVQNVWWDAPKMHVFFWNSRLLRFSREK